MQQADVSALRLLEALVVTLPETLLHTYVLICTDIGVKSPGNPEAQRLSSQRAAAVHEWSCLLHLAVPSCLRHPASVCFAVCLLSLAWALVLYARACYLIRPGHLQMTPAAILCRLLWRVGLQSANGVCLQRLLRQALCRSSHVCICRSACWDQGLPFSCSSHVSSNSGCWE